MVDTDSRNTHTLSLVGTLSSSQHRHDGHKVFSVMNRGLSVFIAAFAIGSLSALAQAFLGVAPPVAYGVCLVGHPRDLLVWITNNILGTGFAIQPVSVELPVLTVIGILAGSAISAAQRKEFRLGKVRSPALMFILGFLVANFALTLGACVLRAVVFIAYGNLHMIIGFLCIVTGVIAGVEYLKWRAGASQ